MKVEKFKRDELFKLEKDYIFHGSPKLFEIGKPHPNKSRICSICVYGRTETFNGG